MIIPTKNIVLAGGLGNQLFQWAYGHKATIDGNQTKFNLVCERRIVWNERPYGLNDLEKSCKHVRYIYRSDLPRKLGTIRRYTHIAKFRSLAWIAKKVGVSLEKAEFSNLGSDLGSASRFLLGYWQNASYFEPNKDVLFTELNEALSRVPAIDRLEGIGNFLAIHVRRGDYLELGSSFGILSEDYYVDTFLRFSRSNRAVVIFSDDFDAALALAKRLGTDLYFGPSEATPWQVLKYLGSSEICITANSSLSWWGGWICEKRGGVAIVPEPWFRDLRVPRGTLQFQGATVSTSDWIDL